jgi:hypothetical protein
MPLDVQSYINSRYMGWVYILVAVMWLTPAAFIMAPVHVLEILVAIYGLGYKLEGNDALMIFIWGIPHIMQACPPASQTCPPAWCRMAF